jgi:hypothetical protein
MSTQPLMPNGVHPPMTHVEAASREAAVDRIVTQTDPPELLTGDDAVLACSDRRDLTVRAANRTFAANIAVNVAFAIHGRRLPGKGARDVRGARLIAPLIDKKRWRQANAEAQRGDGPR